MKISTKGRYALRMMIDLAQQQKSESCYIPLRDIANRQGIDIKYLEQIVSLLKKDGLIQGVRGNNGGYRLTRDPSEYTAWEILKVTEGNLAPVPVWKPKGISVRAETAVPLFLFGRILPSASIIF